MAKNKNKKNTTIKAEESVKENKPYLVSVITTYYNAKNFILDAVRSITKQRYVDGGVKFTIEYVIVDDCSPDETHDILSKYIEEYESTKSQHSELVDIKFVHITPEHNLGCGGARRYGIEHGTGDLFMFLDADDYYINDDFIQRAVNDIVNENADVVEYGLIFNTAGKEPQRSCVNQKIILDNQKIMSEIHLYKNNIIRFNVWTKIYRADIVHSFRYSTERTYEDVRTIPIWIWKANKIVIMPSCEINYRASAGSIIREDVLATRLGTIRAIADNCKIFKASREILKAMYSRAMVDFIAVLDGHDSDDPGFIEMSQLNTYMLSLIFPDRYKEMTADVES